MTITLRPGSTVMFTGDSITDCGRRESEDGLGYGYPLRVAGQWGLRHPDRPVTWLNSGNAADKVSDLEARWRADVLGARPDVVSILVGVNDVGWHSYDPDGHAALAQAWLRLVG
jgi:lysophospholipase L1-like esterase